MARPPDRHADDTSAERVIVPVVGLEELTAIREALDAIRGDITWWINNQRRGRWQPVQPVTGIPADTVASLPHAQPSDGPSPVPRNQACTAPAPQPPIKTAAAPTESLDDDMHFCCQSPDLQWTGDPHVPGVACMNCGYIVADCGPVVMQPSPEADPDPKPAEQQRGLFAEE